MENAGELMGRGGEGLAKLSSSDENAPTVNRSAVYARLIRERGERPMTFASIFDVRSLLAS